MPFKSKAQVRKFAEMVKKGVISQAKFDQWVEKTSNLRELPERIGTKSQKKAKKRGG